MNEAQYNIVKSFQIMRSEPRKLARVFKIDYGLVARVYSSTNYEDFLNHDSLSGMPDLSDKDFLSGFGL